MPHLEPSKKSLSKGALPPVSLMPRETGETDARWRWRNINALSQVLATSGRKLDPRGAAAIRAKIVELKKPPTPLMAQTNPALRGKKPRVVDVPNSTRYAKGVSKPLNKNTDTRVVIDRFRTGGSGPASGRPTYRFDKIDPRLSKGAPGGGYVPRTNGDEPWYEQALNAVFSAAAGLSASPHLDPPSSELVRNNVNRGTDAITNRMAGPNAPLAGKIGAGLVSGTLTGYLHTAAEINTVLDPQASPEVRARALANVAIEAAAPKILDGAWKGAKAVWTGKAAAMAEIVKKTGVTPRQAMRFLDEAEENLRTGRIVPRTGTKAAPPKVVRASAPEAGLVTRRVTGEGIRTGSAVPTKAGGSGPLPGQGRGRIRAVHPALQDRDLATGYFDLDLPDKVQHSVPPVKTDSPGKTKILEALTREWDLGDKGLLANRETNAQVLRVLDLFPDDLLSRVSLEISDEVRSRGKMWLDTTNFENNSSGLVAKPPSSRARRGAIRREPSLTNSPTLSSIS